MGWGTLLGAFVGQGGTKFGMGLGSWLTLLDAGMSIMNPTAPQKGNADMAVFLGYLTSHLPGVGALTSVHLSAQWLLLKLAGLSVQGPVWAASQGRSLAKPGPSLACSPLL